MTTLRLLTIGMAASLAYNASLAGPVALGLVVVANRAHINTAAVTTGATVYDGDRFSTETGGSLLLRGNGATLQLAGGSEVIVRSRTNGVRDIEAELNRGTLAFRSWQMAALEIVADEARIRPASEAGTVGEVRVVSSKELAAYALRGALQFSYRGETETIPEGKAYRVILDPPGNESGKDKKEPINDRKKKAFLLIVIGGEAGVIAWEIHERIESPDRP